MKHRLACLISCALLASASSAALAAPSDSGWYVGAGVGKASNKLHNVENVPNQKTSATAYKLYGGYMFSPYFGTELEYMNLGSWRNDYDGGAASVRASALAMSVIGALPLGEQFSLFGKLGLATRFTQTDNKSDDGRVRYEFKDTSTSYLLGAGAQWNFTPSMALRAEYQYIGDTAADHLNTKIDNSLFSLGLQYKF